MRKRECEFGFEYTTSRERERECVELKIVWGEREGK